MRRRTQKTIRVLRRPIALIALSLAALLTFLPSAEFLAAFAESQQTNTDELNITSNLTDQPILPDDKIELRLSREPQASEGRLAVLINQIDFTNLFTVTEKTRTYNRKILPLPLGESQLTIYLISPADEWREIARFTLQVTNQKKVEPKSAASQPLTSTEPVTTPIENKGSASATTTQPEANSSANATSSTPEATGASTTNDASTPQTDVPDKKSRFEKLDFLPSITIGFKSQSAESHFPDSTRPQRPTFADLTLQGSFKTEMARGIFNSQTQFDIAGSSFKQEALRFGTLGNDAPNIDLSSYLMQFQISKAKFFVGHTGYGSNRHLINNFSSRGITLTIPFTTRFDFSFAALNGTSIVGFDNFIGLDKRKHQMVSGTLGTEFLAKRPGGARLEISLLSGYLLPVNNVNQGNVNDAERSQGLGFRFVGSDPNQRFRFDAGFTRSRFFNPADALLNQGNEVVQTPNLTRNAEYLETGIDLLKDVAITKDKKLTLTFNFRHERVDPLFRSLAASTQSDKIQNQYEAIANLGDINITVSNLLFNDNLNDIPSILKSLTRAQRYAVGMPLLSLFGDPAKPNPWLPRIAYSFDRLHQFGDAIPVNGGFEIAVDSIPNQFADVHSFTADWQFQKFRAGYRFNRSLQNNQQTGRELADLLNTTNAFSIGVSPATVLDLNFEFSRDSANNFEQKRIDNVYRLASIINWRIGGRAALATNFSTTLNGDVAETTRNRNIDFDMQFSYQLTAGKEKFKKFSSNAFIRYVNRYARSRDFIFQVNNLTKAQTLNIGLSFTFF
ncbi:MAG: hypothetical protein AB1757_09760 [Acidobacteriota bacterium]